MSLDTNVLDWLDRAVRTAPDKTAFADEEESLSFRELSLQANRIGTALARKLCQVNEPVVCLVDRDVISIAAFMGIVASRNFYVPLDAAMPPERLSLIIEHIHPAAIVLHGDQELQGDCKCPGKVLRLEELIRCEADEELLARLRANSTQKDPLYAICTSGSTGIPKVVLKSHESVLSFMPVFAETFGFDADEVFANQAPFDFDVSAKDIYTTLHCAASMHVVPRVCFAMPKALAPFLQERGATCCIWAVSALCVVAQLNAFKREKPEKLRKVLFSGEVMPPKHLDRWRSWYPDGMFVNLYAPSEVTGNCLYHIVGTGEGPDGRLPLGIPFKNCDVMVLAEGNVPAQPGQSGEIYVKCPHLALGYYRDPERTARSFVQDPTDGRWPQTVYKTGDVARLDEDGKYYFSGRIDFQIKHMGHRIELEELELHLNAVDGVQRACCVFDTTRNKIVAFYEGEPEAKDIIKALNAKLPKYMIPNVFTRVETMPVNARGKIDRQGLLAQL